jgi:hypothetical protein
VFGLEFVPPDSFGAVVIRPRRLIESPRMATIAEGEPFDELRREAGFGPEDLEQVLLVVGPAGFSKGDIPAEFGVVLRFNHPVDADVMFERWCGRGLERQTVRERTFYSDGREMGGFQADPQTLIIGLPSFARRMLTAGGSGPLVERLREAGDGGDLVGVLLVDQARFLFEDGMAEVREAFQREFPKHNSAFLDLPRFVQSAVLTARVTDVVKGELTLEARDAESAMELEGLVKEGIQALESLFYQELLPELEGGKDPSLDAVRDLLENMRASARVSRSGSRVALHVGGR